AQEADELVERRGVEAAVLFQALFDVLAELLEVPTRLGHADDRDVEAAALYHRLQRGKDLFIGEIAGRSEEDERVGMCIGHGGPSNQVARWLVSFQRRITASRRVCS